MGRRFPVKRLSVIQPQTLSGSLGLPGIPARVFGRGKGIVWDMLEHGLTQSSMATYSTCPMKAKYKLLMGLEAGKYNPALDFGTLFHDTLDKVYSQRVRDLHHPSYLRKVNGDRKKLLKIPYLWDEVVKHSLANKRVEVLAQKLDPADQQEFDRLWGMCGVVLPRYFDRWKHDDNRYFWVAVEEVFEFDFVLPLPNGKSVTITIRGKWDGVVEDLHGNIWLFETKTKSDIEGNGDTSCNALVEKMSYELQVTVYCLAIYHKYGKWPKGVIYNLIKRPGQLYKGTYNKKPESLPQYFDRIEKDMIDKGDAYFSRYTITLYPEEIEFYRDNDLRDLLWRMYWWWMSDGNPSTRVSSACSMWRKPCEFLPLCSGEENAISDYSVREHIFPELVEVDD